MKNIFIDTREISMTVALGRVFVALLVMAGALIVLDVLIFVSATSSTFHEKVADAYDESYIEGFTETYKVGYEEARDEAYNKGYIKGYETSLLRESEEHLNGLVELRNPTYQELREFLAADDTDSNVFFSGEYVCFNFAAELNNKAETNGIRAAYVRIRSSEWAHAVVAFETVDRGLVFIEPQSDTEVDVVIGSNYPWWRVGATSPLRSSDDILEIQLFW
ncbi:hypothetical protein ACFLVU_00390 [Chloroflexota bacterium]